MREPILPEEHIAPSLWRNRDYLLLWSGQIISGTGTSASGIAFPLLVLFLTNSPFQAGLVASSGTIGFIFGVASVGGILGALLGAWLQHRLTLAQAALGGLWSGAMVCPFLAVSPNLAFLTVVGGLLILTGPVYDIAQFSYRMARIPDALQGRVNSLYRMIMFGGQPLGRLAGGVLAQAFGPRTALGAMAAGLVLVSVAATLNRGLRHAQR